VSDQNENHPLRHTLATTEGQLQEAIEQVCEDTVVKESTTDELIRIEETLAIAAETAKQAISLRRRIRTDGEQHPDA
jgi:hypothetical protein